MMRGSALLTRVNSIGPAIPWTTKTPNSRVSFEKAIIDLITVITFSKVCSDPLEEYLNRTRKAPTYFSTNLTLSFLFQSRLSLIFSLISMPVP